MQYELAAANFRPEDLFCYYAICAMAAHGSMRCKFEIARVDHTPEKVRGNNFELVVDKIAFPDAKWWQPFSKVGGYLAFKEKPQLFTSHFNLNGTYAYKYNFWQSMRHNGQEIKMYMHCSGLHTIFVRLAPSLRVYLSTSQIGVGETTHMITLKKVIFPDDSDITLAKCRVIFEKEFGNDDSDITLGQILPVAWCHLIENDHATYATKLEVIFEGLVIFEGYVRPLTRLVSTVLVKRFGRKEPSKRQKTSSGSGGAATPLAEVPRCPPAVAEGPHHTGTTEMATPPPEIMEHMRELRKNNPHAAVIEAVRCPLVPGGWVVNFGPGRIEIEEDASDDEAPSIWGRSSSGLDNDDDDDDDDDDGP
jgi:hypothetical protein